VTIARHATPRNATCSGTEIGPNGLSTLETIVADVGDYSRQCGQAIRVTLACVRDLLRNGATYDGEIWNAGPCPYRYVALHRYRRYLCNANGAAIDTFN